MVRWWSLLLNRQNSDAEGCLSPYISTQSERQSYLFRCIKFCVHLGVQETRSVHTAAVNSPDFGEWKSQIKVLRFLQTSVFLNLQMETLVCLLEGCVSSSHKNTQYFELRSALRNQF